MSAFLLGIGFRADMGTCARKLVLLKLIDACDDDGSRIFPAISTIARAAQCSTRQVQRELKAFLEIGLIRLVREGGKGPRSTNEYALDLDVLHLLGKGGWAVVAVERSKNKGDTVSPLDGGEKGDTGDTVRATPETDKGDKLSHPTPQDPSLDPSVERERGREPEDQKSVERWLKRNHPRWPSHVTDSGTTALKAAMALTPEEREAAAVRMPGYLAAEKASGGRCAFGVYLSEKRWERLGPKKIEAVKPTQAPAFGKVWAAMRMRDLVTGPKASPRSLKRWVERAIVEGRLDREKLEKDNRKSSGWPMVNDLHTGAERGDGIIRYGPVEEHLGSLCEFVPTGTDVWTAWKVEHELRGWPWLPDPGSMPGAYFPAGGPAGLEAFEQAARGKNDDDGERHAAE